jgi:enamine deaminase RidA (YjgF/YER057c/UK114 family)
MGTSVSPLSRALLVGRTLHVSGTLGVDADGRLADGIEAQTGQALANIRALVEEGADRSKTSSRRASISPGGRTSPR